MPTNELIDFFDTPPHALLTQRSGGPYSSADSAKQDHASDTERPLAGKANIRLKVLKATGRRGHRYHVLRKIAQTCSLATLVAVPLTGLARVDFWGGQHRLLFAEATFKHALAGVIIGIGAMYVITFLSNVVAGRIFCGWGCPVAQVSRFGERVDTPSIKPMQRLSIQIQGALYSGLFVLAVLAWWVDLHMLISTSPRDLAIAWGLVVFGTAGAYLHGRYWRWEFCKQVCPIGLYYTFVAPAAYFGVYFRNQTQSCIECDACDNICTVDLKPRDLLTPIEARGGVSISDAPALNHCLECGDCVMACEMMIELKTKADGQQRDVPLLMGYFSGPQRVDKTQAAPTQRDAESLST